MHTLSLSLSHTHTQTRAHIYIYKDILQILLQTILQMPPYVSTKCSEPSNLCPNISATRKEAFVIQFNILTYIYIYMHFLVQIHNKHKNARYVHKNKNKKFAREIKLRIATAKARFNNKE